MSKFKRIVIVISMFYKVLERLLLGVRFSWLALVWLNRSCLRNSENWYRNFVANVTFFWWKKKRKFDCCFCERKLLDYEFIYTCNHDLLLKLLGFIEAFKFHEHFKFISYMSRNILRLKQFQGTSTSLTRSEKKLCFWF